MPATQVENLFKVQNVKFIFVSSKTTEAVLQALWEAKVKTRTSVYVQAVDYPFEQK
jgi:ABC-type Zn uptake system ZnuABC Zn-binding protein ZnuA